MPDSDHDSDRERATDPRFDAWPVEQDEAYADWPVERTVPGEDDAAPETVEEIEWIGIQGGGSNVVAPVLYDPKASSVVTGELDEENERVVLGADHDRHEVDPEDSLGEYIEAFGEEHGWTWLSSFAREYLEDGEGRPPAGPTLQHSEFDRRNLGDSASQDLGFFGSHTFTDATDRVYVLEREFDVFFGGSDGERVEGSDGELVVGAHDEPSEGSADGSALVAVEEELLVAAKPREEERAGDAEVVDEHDYEFAVAVDADDPNREGHLHRTLDEWHADHLGPPTDE